MMQKVLELAGLVGLLVLIHVSTREKYRYDTWREMIATLEWSAEYDENDDVRQAAREALRLVRERSRHA